MSVRQVVKFIWNTRHCAILSYEMAVPFMFHFIKFKFQNVRKQKPDPSMCKWLPKVSFPSITSALENLWPTQWSLFHYVTTNFGCADWHVKMDNDMQPFHRIKGTVRQPDHNLFAITLVAVCFFPLHGGKTGLNHGIIVTFTYFEPQYSPGKSIHIAMYRLAVRLQFVVSVYMSSWVWTSWDEWSTNKLPGLSKGRYL